MSESLSGQPPPSTFSMKTPMIKFIKGDIFESECEAIVNTVNCYGKMGKGLALEFKNRYPEMFLVYKRACDEGRVKVGKMHIWKNIINFPTKDHWRNPSKMEYITSGLQDLVEVIKEKGVKSIAIPPLGCGLGGLNFYLVKKQIEEVHEIHWKEISVVVYEPIT